MFPRNAYRAIPELERVSLHPQPKLKKKDSGTADSERNAPQAFAGGAQKHETLGEFRALEHFPVFLNTERVRGIPVRG